MMYTYFSSYKSRIIIELKRDHLYPLYVEEMVFFYSLRYNRSIRIYFTDLCKYMLFVIVRLRVKLVL